MVALTTAATFLIDRDVAFLNHGSFGACPVEVLDAYHALQREIERRPVAFIARESPALLDEARARLAMYVGAAADDLVFMPNATSGINVVARSLTLAPGDEVLGTSLDYGAVDLTWEAVCRDAGARYVPAPLSLPATDDELVEAVWRHVTWRTRVLSFSHITSGSAVVLPVAELCRRAREAGIVSVVDGAHGIAQVPIDLGSLGADVYAGTCHKWLCAPKGTGFLWIRRGLQQSIGSLIVSWGSGEESTFAGRNAWQGTRDLAGFLTVPVAIDLVSSEAWATEQGRCRALAARARTALAELARTAPLTDEQQSPLQMVAVDVGEGDADELRGRLLDRHGLEVLVTAPVGRTLLRTSFAPYNDERDLDRLLDALRSELPRR